MQHDAMFTSLNVEYRRFDVYEKPVIRTMQPRSQTSKAGRPSLVHIADTHTDHN